MSTLKCQPCRQADARQGEEVEDENVKADAANIMSDNPKHDHAFIVQKLMKRSVKCWHSFIRLDIYAGTKLP